MSDSYVTNPKMYQQSVQVLLLLHPFLPMCTHGNFTYKIIDSISNNQQDTLFPSFRYSHFK